MTDRHIIPFGGMRPTADDRTHPLVDYLLEVVDKPRAKVAIIPTATGDSPETIARCVSRLPADRVSCSHLALFDRTIVDIEAYLMEQDLIWVGGGNTVSMLAVWRAHGVDRALRTAWEAGKVLTGGSAGSLCWFEGGTTDSFDLARLAPLRDGLGFLPGTHCPHYDGEAQRRPLYHALVGDGFPGGYAIDDDAALHFRGTDLVEAVTARRGATAYHVSRVDGGVVETPLDARLLPGAA